MKILPAIMTYIASQSIRPVWIYLLLISATELTTALVSPEIGLTLHALLLLGLTLHAGIGRRTPERNLALALILVPLTRILALTLPPMNAAHMVWFPIASILLLIAAWFANQSLRLKRVDLGLCQGHLLPQLMLIGSGLWLGTVEYFLFRPVEPAPTAWATFTLPALMALVLSAFSEEVIFRGLLPATARPVLGRGTIVYVSLIFAILHIGYLSAVAIVFAFGMGLIFNSCARWSGSILGVTLAHSLAHATCVWFIPFLNQQEPGTLILASRWLIASGITLAVLAVLLLLLRKPAYRHVAQHDNTSETSNSSPVITYNQQRTNAAIMPAISLMRTMRRRAGLSYSDLALRTGLPSHLLAQIEMGLRSPRPEQLVRIAQALEIEPHMHAMIDRQLRRR